MKEIDINELKKLQVEILVKVHEFCERMNIRYFMGYGTLLGAVRHKGYIPWDDDIDIGMPRPDYDRFLKIFNGHYKNLTVIAPELDWNFIEPYANVYDNRTILIEENRRVNLGIGVKIDIFPIDGVPEDFEEYVKLRKTLKSILEVKAYKLLGFKDYVKLFSRPKFLLYIFMKLMPYLFTSCAKLQRKIYYLATQNNFATSQYVDKITFQNKPLTRLPREVYEEFLDMEFEGHMLKGLKDYDSHLKVIYGDYMILPPKEQQVFRHGFKAYWK